MGRCHVLLVEDHADTRSAIVRMLTKLGHTVCEASTVAEAMALLDGQHVAIVDLNLPDGLGTEVIAAIRAQGRPIRTALWTASARHQMPSLASFADVLFSKPEHLSAMLDWVAEQADGA